MEMRLVNGDYVPDGWGGFESVTGTEELLERILFKLKARRGGFPLLPELGSRLYLLGREKPSVRLSAAKQYVIEALSEESEVSLAEVSLRNTGDDTVELTVSFNYAGETLGISLEV